MKIEFIRDKETKNTIRFTAPTGTVTGSVYVQKSSEFASGDHIAVEILEKETAESHKS